MAPPRTMHWFRWYHGTANDSKIRRIAVRANTPVVNVLGVWAMVLESASENVERGVIGSWDAEDVAFTLGIDASTVVLIRDKMQGLLLDGDKCIAWAKRNPKREKSDPASESAPDEADLGTSAPIGAIGSTSAHIGADGDASEPEERRGEESIKNKSKRLSSPKAPKPNKKYPHYPIDVCDQLYEVYKTNRGAIDYATFRKLTSPLFPTNYALDQIIHAMEAWLEYVEGIGPEKAKWEKLPEFCGNLERWVRIGAMPLADENGVTERGRLCCGIAA